MPTHETAPYTTMAEAMKRANRLQDAGFTVLEVHHTDSGYVVRYVWGDPEEN